MNIYNFNPFYFNFNINFIIMKKQVEVNKYDENEEISNSQEISNQIDLGLVYR